MIYFSFSHSGHFCHRVTSPTRAERAEAAARPERVASPPRSPPAEGEDVLFEGPLSRKHEWESTTKKASHRSWEKGLYVVLRKSSLSVYKDQKHYLQEPMKTYRGEGAADLVGAVAAVPPDYTKRKNVFRLKLASGAEYLFEAKNADEMNTWIGRINEAIGELQRTAAGSSRTSQTLPARSESTSRDPEREEAKKKAAKKTKTMLPS